MLTVPGRLHPIETEYVGRADADIGAYRCRSIGRAAVRLDAVAWLALLHGGAALLIWAVPHCRSPGSQRRAPPLDVMPYIQLLSRIDNICPPTERGDVLVRRQRTRWAMAFSSASWGPMSLTIDGGGAQVFLPGMDDIARLCEAAREYAAVSKRWVVLALHSRCAHD